MQQNYHDALLELRCMTEERDVLAGHLDVVRGVMAHLGEKLVEGAKIPPWPKL